MIKSQRIKVSGSHHAYSYKMTYINYINIDVSMYIYIYVCKLSIYNHQPAQLHLKLLVLVAGMSVGGVYIHHNI